MTQKPRLLEFIPNRKIEIELVYKDAAHQDNHFVMEHHAVYPSDMVLYLERHLCDIIHATYDFIPHGQKLRLYDGFRPPVAQRAMAQIRDLRGYRKDLVSEEGEGAHPRGMAIDLALVEKKNNYGLSTIDYGCGFDDFTLVNQDTGYPTENQEHAIPLAGRNTKFIPFLAKQNRLALEVLMQKAALKCGVLLMPLPQEWWDFRFPANETSLKYVLASFNRILFDMYGAAPDINSYDDFCAYWDSHYNDKNIPPEKRHIFGFLPQARALKPIYYDDYDYVYV